VTGWDLGIGDSTAIWCAQNVANEMRLIDYHENAGVGLDDYVRWLQSTGYIFGEHVLPHDVMVRELGSGKSRYETLHALGLQNITVAPQLRVDDGIQAVRSAIPNCWFDSERCEDGLDALRQYRREYDERRQTYNARPLHDWASHGADAFRYLITGSRQKQRQGWNKPLRRNLKGAVA